MTKSKHTPDDPTTDSQNGNHVLDLSHLGTKEPNKIVVEEANRDRIAPAITPIMDFSALTIREVLEHFFRTNDPSAWADFKYRIRSTIRGRCAIILKMRATDDLLDNLEQDAHAKLIDKDYKYLRNFDWRTEDAIFKYLKTVAISVTYDWLRPNPIELDSVEDLINDPIAPNTSPDKKILLDEIEKCLLTVTSGKDGERDRAIFKLYYRRGFTARQIAGLPSINLRVKKVENILQRLVCLVKNKLNKKE